MAKLYIPPSFRTTLSFSQYGDIVSGAVKYYTFLGRSTGWPDELNPPDVSSSFQFETETRKNILVMKQIENKNVSLGVRRYDWAGGIVYDYYDDINLNPDTAKYFVINSENNIYKCIWNGGGAPSNVEPRGTPLSIVELSDGYKWKYLFTVSDSDLEKFLLPDFIPIKDVTTGSSIVESILVESGGSGYLDGTAVKVIITGDGVGATATATVSGGVVRSVKITSGGSGYSYAVATIDQMSSPMGSGVDLRVIVDKSTNTSVQSLVQALAVDGAINHLIVESSGSDYLNTVKIEIDGDGEGALAEPIIDAGKIVGINVISPGFGYRRTVVNVVKNSPSDPGSGGQIRAIISPLGGHGSDLKSELFAIAVMFYATFEFEGVASDFFVNNEFRQLGLVRAPTLFGSSTPATDVTYNACYVINFDRSITIDLDDVLQNEESGVALRLVEIRDSNKGFFQSIGNFPPQVGDELKSASDTQSINIINVVPPEIDAFSGSIIFIENRTSITRSKDQVETLKTVLKY